MLHMFCCILLSRASIILRPLPDLQYLGVLHLSPFGTGISALGAHARNLVDAFDLLLHEPVIGRAGPFQRLVAPVWLRLFPPLILHPPFPLSAGEGRQPCHQRREAQPLWLRPTLGLVRWTPC